MPLGARFARPQPPLSHTSRCYTQFVGHVECGTPWSKCENVRRLGDLASTVDLSPLFNGRACLNARYASKGGDLNPRLSHALRVLAFLRLLLSFEHFDSSEWNGAGPGRATLASRIVSVPSADLCVTTRSARLGKRDPRDVAAERWGKPEARL